MAAILTPEQIEAVSNSGMMVCVRCEVRKPLSEFTKHRRMRFGVTSTCRACHADRQKQERREHPERVRGRDRRRIRTDADRVRMNEWRIANRERANANMRQACLRRRARMRGNDARTITPRDLAHLKHRQRGCCFYCGDSQRKLTLDHLIPIARGGRHAIGNVVYACFKCNRRKGTMLPVESKQVRSREGWRADNLGGSLVVRTPITQGADG